MARYIHCPKCSERMRLNAIKFEELYEAIEGRALRDFVCDSCGGAIKALDHCFAAVLLDNKEHPNYHQQHPSSWSQNYINPLPSISTT